MNNISKLVMLGSVVITLSSCGDSWLDPKPLSFYSPENTLVDAKGMWAALGTCEKRIKAEFYGDGPAIITEHIFSEVAIEGTTDKTSVAQDLNAVITPDKNLNSPKIGRAHV